MSAEWPIAASSPAGRLARASTAVMADGDGRLAAIVQDLFLSPQVRLTEQERSLMTEMLHGLIERIAIELRARLSPDLGDSGMVAPADLVADLTRAGLIQDEALVALLLRRADVQRIASSSRGGRSLLHRWTADADGTLAAAAMTLVAARGRGRDRFGRPALDLSDLPEPLATGLVVAVAAALALRITEPSHGEMADAIRDLIDSRAQLVSPEDHEVALADALGPEGRRAPGLLVTLAEEGEAPILAAVLAAEACIPADEAWAALIGGAEKLALLLRLAGIPRPQAAALLAAAGPALGIGDPVQAIEAFDAMDGSAVEDIRAELVLPAAYRHARRMIARHG